MISIIITSFKEPHTIGRAIRAALSQKISGNYEILVVAPDRETRNAAQTYAKNDKRVRVLADAGKGKPSALNLAFREARGDILILTDGDVYMGVNAVSFLLKALSGKNVGAATGRVVSTNGVNTAVNYWAYLGAETFHKMRLMQKKQKENVLCTGYLYAVLASLVKSVPVDTLADDAFITHNLWSQSVRTVYEPRALVYVHYPTTLIDWIRQKKRTAARFYQNSKQFGISKIRSLSNELTVGIYSFEMIRNVKQIFWFMGLMVMRAYLWGRIMFDKRLWRRSFNKVWERIESSKK